MTVGGAAQAGAIKAEPTAEAEPTVEAVVADIARHAEPTIGRPTAPTRAYVLDSYSEGEITIVATGSEVPLGVAVAELLKKEGIGVRVVSAPSLDLFDRQDVDYQNQVLGTDRSKLVAIEAGRTSGWYKYVNHDALVIGLDRFGASAPAEQLAEHFGFTPEKVADRIREWKK